MNQRPNLSRMIILSSLTLLMGSILLTGCGGKSTADIAEFQALISMEGETSIELIETAVSDGKINYESSLLYKMYAIYGDEKLPEQYRSPKKFRNANGVIKEVQSMMGTLSQAAQAELAPFFRRPNDPESYINIKYREAMSGDQTFLISNAKYQRPNIVSESIESENGLVKIWYPSVTTSVQPYSGSGNNIQVSAETVKKMAERLKKAIDDDDIMERFYDLLQRNIVKDGNRGGDDKLDIYVIPSGGDDGMTTCEDSPPPCSTFIQINTNLELSRNNILITTLAHEIFHSFQYAYKYHTVDDDWWSEATAVWSEDFIYPGLNTEHSWLDEFIYHPGTELYSKTNPNHHEYGAYLFPYYLSESTSEDGFMKASWEGCERQRCLKALDGIIDGGYKEQWKEFTLWNYNKDPVKYYSDVGGFPAKSSEDGNNIDFRTIYWGTEFVDTVALDPLSAFLVEVSNQANRDEIKRLVFKDLNNFTGLNENAAIKAVIYYNNGTQEVEDWTDKRERSFCIDNTDEDFERIMLIFSNADMKESIPASDIDIDGKDNCYHIEQEDDRTAIFHLPYSDGGVYKIASMSATIETNSYGEPQEKAEEGQQFAYLTQWKVLNHFESIKSAFSIECDGTSIEVSPGWTERSASYLVFDLGPDGLNQDGTFSIDLHYGLPHPNGNYAVRPDMDTRCINAFIGGAMIDLSGYTGVIEDLYVGRIFDMTKDGARIEVEDCCLLHSCTLQDGVPFQELSEPVILEIKK